MGGRPKEEGGHKTLKISVDKFVSDGLKKVPNKSQFIEKVARPVLEKLDPGELSPFLWQVDFCIRQKIIDATKEDNFKLVSGLSFIANCLEDARKLCGKPHDKSLIPKIAEAEKPTETIELIDIRPEWCGTKSSIEHCMEQGEPIFKEIKHTLHGREERLIFDVKDLKKA